jgi:transposase
VAPYLTLMTEEAPQRDYSLREVFNGLRGLVRAGASWRRDAKHNPRRSFWTVEVAFVDEGYTGEKAAQAAEGEGIRLEVIKLPDVKKGFVLLPRRWVVERSFRRLARDYERLPETLIGLHFLALAILMAKPVGETMLIVHSS